ncbi:MAG: ferrous iron transport protein B [Puniceicoccales bacterium]|jgi:ferrous iron transport protein B|nr:ferrous iron transport protein B [Puniceicoccales bacterium]
MIHRIALLGQPNTGKSTLFNLLTCGHRRTGNWPGNTVDMAEGSCSHDSDCFTIVDLPGTYGLTPHSMEERLTMEQLGSGNLHGAIIFLDASQLSRSLYFLSDFIGIHMPVMIVVSMVDILQSRGKNVDICQLESILGVPVVAISPNCQETMERVKWQLSKMLRERPMLPQEMLSSIYEKVLRDGTFVLEQVSSINFSTSCHPFWLVLKCLEESDGVKFFLPKEQAARLRHLTLRGNHMHAAMAMRIASCRYEWIKKVLSKVVLREKIKNDGPQPFDRFATHPFWGLFLAILLILVGFAVSIRFATFCQCILKHLLQKLFLSTMPLIPVPLETFLQEAIVPGLLIATYLMAFVGGLTLFLGIMENIGYIARIAYLFDGIMERVGLQGKCILPFLSGFGCTVAAVHGSRIIDSPRQRLLTIATCWIIPCSGTWGMVTLISGLFFGAGAIWMILFLFFLAAMHIAITSRLFRGKNFRCRTVEGLLMELPPYHRPNWKQIGVDLRLRINELMHSSIPIILFTGSTLWWFMRHGEPLIRHMEKHFHLFELITGLRWEMLMVLLLSVINRESALGGLAILLPRGGGSFTFGTFVNGAHLTDLQSSLLATLDHPQAIAFLVAFFLNVPCCAAIAATACEVKSFRWTCQLIFYYFCFSILCASITFHLSSLVF